LRVIYYRKKLDLIILIVVYEGAQSLIYILVYNLRLSVRLRVVSGEELQLNIQNPAEFLLKIGYELKTTI
jgi:hypothetical protein